MILVLLTTLMMVFVFGMKNSVAICIIAMTFLYLALKHSMN